jgi:D-cysteine desulfhydrase
LADLPRAQLGVFPTPVAPVSPGDGSLWIKRDDLNAEGGAIGGNKVRSLEWLLGGVGADETILTGGGDGSTHVLATAMHAARLGAPTVAVRWRHEMHPIAESVARRSAAACARTIRTRTVVGAYARLAVLRATTPRCRYIPPGGATALGTLGHVDAGLELAGQVAGGELPEPAVVVVPLGTGATAAGLALGLGIAGLDTRVVAVRVVPRIALAEWRIGRLIAAARRLLVARAGASATALPAVPVEIDHSRYGGAYGRPLRGAVSMDGITLDATYSAKAATAAAAFGRTARGHDAGRPVLFWLTFDGRSL